MENKTCGECQWYDHHHLLCVIGGDVKPTERAKDCFVSAKLTNGDKIRQMSNEELAKLIVPKDIDKMCDELRTLTAVMRKVDKMCLEACEKKSKKGTAK